MQQVQAAYPAKCSRLGRDLMLCSSQYLWGLDQEVYWGSSVVLALQGPHAEEDTGDGCQAGQGKEHSAGPQVGSRGAAAAVGGAGEHTA